jgi:hypothetical protein
VWGHVDVAPLWGLCRLTGRQVNLGSLHTDPGPERQIFVRWKFWYDREGVGPRWPW